MHTTRQPDDTQPCRNSDHCRQPTTAQSPLCPVCLDHATRDIRALLWDWIDLEQLQIPSLAQALTGQPNGTAAPAMPLSGAPEALQAEILHVTTTWETEIRAARRLADPNPGPVRDGHAVQRATRLLANHIQALAELTAAAVYPTGCEDQPTDMDGTDAIGAITGLHRRARAMLGRTVRTFWIPGDCWGCDARTTPGTNGPLYRSEPTKHEDEPPVWCAQCGEWRSYDDYQQAIAMIVWPKLHGRQEAA